MDLVKKDLLQLPEEIRRMVGHSLHLAQISCIIKRRKLTQTQVAEILGVDQPRVSSLLRGRLDLFSVEKLMHFLKALGQDIEIRIKPKPRNRKHAHLSVVSGGERNSLPIAARSR